MHQDGQPLEAPGLAGEHDGEQDAGRGQQDDDDQPEGEEHAVHGLSVSVHVRHLVMLDGRAHLRLVGPYADRGMPWHRCRRCCDRALKTGQGSEREGATMKGWHPMVDRRPTWEHRFVLESDGSIGRAHLRRRGNDLVMIHTGVPEELDGRGIGGRLVQAAIDRAARDGLTIVPGRPFARVDRTPSRGPLGSRSTGRSARYDPGRALGAGEAPVRWPPRGSSRTSSILVGTARRSGSGTAAVRTPDRQHS